jgi:hypothetical protein
MLSVVAPLKQARLSAYIYSKKIRPKHKEHRQPIHLASKLGELSAPAR